MNPKGPTVSTSLELGFYVHITIPGFYMDTGDQTQFFYVCMVNNNPTGLFPNLHFSAFKILYNLPIDFWSAWRYRLLLLVCSQWWKCREGTFLCQSVCAYVVALRYVRKWSIGLWCGVCFLQWPAQVVLIQACKRISYLCISKRLWGSVSKMATLKK